MSIIRPRVWTQQPQVPVEVDWGNPLASGLVLCASLPHKIDCVTGKKFSTNEVGASNKVIASKYSASSASVRYSTPYSLSAGSDFSLISVISRYVSGGSNPGLWREGAASTGSTFTIFQGGGGLPWIRVNGVDVLQPSSGLAINTSSGAYNTVAFRVRSATDAAAFFNGVKAHSSAHTTATPACGFYNFGWQLGEYCGDIAGVWLFNRALSDHELCNLTNNPWQIFRPRVT